MNRASRLRHTRPSPKRLTSFQLFVRIAVVLLVLLLLSVAGFLLYRSLNQRGDPAAVSFNLTVNPRLNPAEATYLSTYLTSNRDLLYMPANENSDSTPFEILPGETASTVADNLASKGLITDQALFRNYLRYYGLDVQLEAGQYELSPSMTIPEIAVALTDARPIEIVVSIPEGWRREQIADWIDQQADLSFSGSDFLAATQSGAVAPARIESALPDGSSLEGFLFPDTYLLARDSSADDLVSKMLENFAGQVTTEMVADGTAQGMSLYDVLRLASIVEREAVVADERPTIASVYLNRLAVGMRLEADPTVQYAQGFQPVTGEWWNTSLTLSDYTSVNSPYNTYLYSGLPPTPIANPGLSSILAVIYPDETPYFFFRATCDGSGRHEFAVTFEEHLANACP